MTNVMFFQTSGDVLLEPVFYFTEKQPNIKGAVIIITALKNNTILLFLLKFYL
jgi:hypothetical protein